MMMMMMMDDGSDTAVFGMLITISLNPSCAG